MVKLTESDIRYVANGRFWDKWYWWAFGLLVAAGFSSGFLLLYFKSYWGFLPLGVYCIWIGWLCWKVEKYKKELVEEWKKSQQG